MKYILTWASQTASGHELLLGSVRSFLWSQKKATKVGSKHRDPRTACSHLLPSLLCPQSPSTILIFTSSWWVLITSSSRWQLCPLWASHAESCAKGWSTVLGLGKEASKQLYQLQIEQTILHPHPHVPKQQDSKASELLARPRKDCSMP